MKIRSNYVSNSSSSSFIITKDLNDLGISCLKLTRAQKEKINGLVCYDEKVMIYPDKDYWLTEFIYDGDDRKWNIIEKGGEHHVYAEGQMCGEPYDFDRYYNEYQMSNGKSVYLRKEHDKVKQMKINKFAKTLKDQYGTEIEVLVEYTDDDKIVLTPIMR